MSWPGSGADIELVPGADTQERALSRASPCRYRIWAAPAAAHGDGRASVGPISRLATSGRACTVGRARASSRLRARSAMKEATKKATGLANQRATRVREPAVVRPTSLRILIVSMLLPDPPTDGYAMRVRGLMLELARRHRVTLVAYASAEENATDDLRSAGIDVRLVTRGRDRNQLWRWLSVVSRRSFRSRFFDSRELRAAVRSVLASERFDIVQLESTELWPLDLDVPGSSHIVVLDAVNVWSELLARTTAVQKGVLRRAYWALETWKFTREERACWQRVDGVVLTSERESEIVQRTPGVRAARVVPNAVDVDTLRPQHVSTNKGEILFTGSMSYHPNADAVVYFVRDVLPLVIEACPDAYLTVVGKGVPPELTSLSGPRVRFTGLVPDVRPYFAHTAVVVAPLRAGSGTRLKILEALAMGKGVVSTSIGCEGLDVTSGRDILVADGPEPFAAAVARLLDRPDDAAALGRHGRALVERRYTWAIAVEELERFYFELLQRRVG